LVEDDLNVRRTLVSALTRSGFQVTVAGSLGETLRALETRDDFSVLVSDVHLPEDSGLEIAAAVRERLPALPVMFISGNPGDLLDVFGDAPARVSFLQKPFVPKTFVAKVANACQGHSGTLER
jgi:DNA-binding response OmpR family regulator